MSKTATPTFKRRASDASAQLGDKVLLDFTGLIDGQPFPGGEQFDFTVVLGDGTLPDSFVDALVGATEGDRQIDVVMPVGDHVGKTANFAVNLREIHEPVVDAADPNVDAPAPKDPDVPTPAPKRVKLTPAGALALDAAQNARCLYKSKDGYSLSGTGGKQHTHKIINGLVARGLLLEEPTGGRDGAVKITKDGTLALRAYVAASKAA